MNCFYPHRMPITGTAVLKRAFMWDYVCAEYKDNRRSSANFIASDCIPMDLDNDHSDDPAEWISPDAVVKQFPDVTIAIHYSRNHMKIKNGKSPRPRFHVIFRCSQITSSKDYRALKERLCRAFPYFDENALDAGRFLFGTKEANCELYIGKDTIEECLEKYYPENDTASSDDLSEDLSMLRSIPEGRRNATLSRFAGKILKRFGKTEKAEQLFNDEAGKCDPPMAASELKAIWRSAVSFYDRISKNPEYVPPDQYANQYVTEFSVLGREYDPVDRTDVGQAELLARFDGGDRIRYSDQMGFLYYDGVRWRESEPMATGVAQELTEAQMKEAKAEMEAAWKKCVALGVDKLLQGVSRKKAEGSMKPDQLAAFREFTSAEAYYDWAENRRSSRYISATLQQVKPLVLISPDDLDADYLLMNCPEKTYDLSKGAEGGRKHRAKDYCTCVTNFEPSDDGREIWEKSLATTFCHNPELVEYVQQICGLACIGKVFSESMIIAYGDGANGKSTFWNTIFRVLGSYAKTISAEALTTSCTHNTKPEIAELKGRRFVLASELKEGCRLNTSTVKQLTSIDPVHAEKKYYAPFDFDPTHTLVLYTNHLPKVGAMDNGIWRRLIVVPFKARIEGNGEIKNYSDYLLEHAGGAVLK